MACATGPPRLARNFEELPVEGNLKVIPMMQSQTEGQIPVQSPHSPTTVGTKRLALGGWLAGIVVLLLFVGLLVSGILERIHTNASLRTETADMAVPTVLVVTPKRAAPTQEIVLPGNVQPYITSPVFAGTNGYLEHWTFDIGRHVEKGKLLAVIASPEVDQQLQQADSNLLTAKANLDLA